MLILATLCIMLRNQWTCVSVENSAESLKSFWHDGCNYDTEMKIVLHMVTDDSSMYEGWETVCVF